MLRTSQKNRYCGFTLLEMIIVVIIIGILAMVSVPYASSGDDVKVIAAAAALAADIQYAQNVAITFQLPITVAFNTSANTYSLLNASGILNHPISKSEYVIDFESKHGVVGVDVVSADFDGLASVTFDELGAAEIGGSVVLNVNSVSYTISVAAVTGKVTVSSGG